MNRLQQLLDDGIIEEIHTQLKSGKEADVWLVSHRGEPVAAKLYKERAFRSFKNDAGYREGREVRSSRTQRAMDRGSRFGREASEEAWKSAEAEALQALYAAGVRVPKPVLFYEGVLLMEAIGDAEGRVAPRLVDAGLDAAAAGALYPVLRGEVIKMLASDLIHGDLSEFNVLLASDGPVIIDFPQVVTAAKNSMAERYFKRDLENLRRFLQGFDPTLARHELDGEEIWRAYVRRDLSAGFVPTGRLPGGSAAGGGGRRGKRRGGERGPFNGGGNRGAQPGGNGGRDRAGQFGNGGSAEAAGQFVGDRNRPSGGTPGAQTPSNGGQNGGGPSGDRGGQGAAGERNGQGMRPAGNGGPIGQRARPGGNPGPPGSRGGAAPNGQGRGAGSPRRGGPEVSFKGQGPAAPAQRPSAPRGFRSAPAQPAAASRPAFAEGPSERRPEGGGGHRRRPRRRF
jgi:RIO kinase 1